MTCDELKNLAQSGRLLARLAEPDVRAHLTECVQCAALYGADGGVARVLVAGSAWEPGVHEGLGFEIGDLDSLRGELQTELSAEANNPWNLLRDLRTNVRRLVVLAVVGVLFVSCLALSARSDLATYPLPRLAIELVLLFSLVGAAVWEGTRTLVEPSRNSNRTSILAVCVAAPVVLAFVSSLAPVAATEGTSNLHSVVKCMSWGTAVALPAAFILWLSKRENPWEEARVPLLAATLGVVGNLLLQIHCPSSEFVHLICAHAPLLVVFALGLGLWGRVTTKKTAG